jgi:hypothetical protein
MTHGAHPSAWNGSRPAAVLCVLALLSCSGHRISSWSPSGSLEWERPPEGDEEGADAGADGLGEDTMPAGEAVAEPDGGRGDETPRVDDPAMTLARADRLYAEGSITAAVQVYGVVFATGGPYEQAWALYRIAWCAVNLEQLEQASDRMEQLLRMLEAPSDEGEIRLRRDAVHDLALFESMRGDVVPARAIERIERVLGGEEREAALRTLADQYRAAGRLDDEQAVRERLSAPGDR